MPDDWKTPSCEDAVAFAEEMKHEIFAKFIEGRKQYGNVWAGTDPLDHAISELIDALLYLWWEKRKLGQS